MSQTIPARSSLARSACQRAYLPSLLALVLCPIATTAYADLWSAGYADHDVIRYDEYTGAILPNGIPVGSGGLSGAAGVAVGPDGNIYVSSQFSGQVLKYDGETGASLGSFATMPDDDPEDEFFPGPGDLLFADGNLYVADFFGTTVRTFNGTTGAYIDDAATGLAHGGGLALSPDGDLLVGEVNLDTGISSIYRIDGGNQQVFIPAFTGGMLSAASILVAPNNYIYVVDLIGNQVIRFDENGLNPFAFEIPPHQDLPDSNFPSDIALVDGNLIVSVLGIDYDDHGVLLRYDLDGNLLETIADGLRPIGAIARTYAFPQVPGDYNGDGVVDSIDYTAFNGQFGDEVPAGRGADGNGDGRVSAADYTIWRDHLGSSAGLGSSTFQSIPEPSTLLLIGCALMLALVGRDRLVSWKI